MGPADFGQHYSFHPHLVEDLRAYLDVYRDWFSPGFRRDAHEEIDLYRRLVVEFREVREIERPGLASPEVVDRESAHKRQHNMDLSRAWGKVEARLRKAREIVADGRPLLDDTARPEAPPPKHSTGLGSRLRRG